MTKFELGQKVYFPGYKRIYSQNPQVPFIKKIKINGISTYRERADENIKVTYNASCWEFASHYEEHCLYASFIEAKEKIIKEMMTLHQKRGEEIMLYVENLTEDPVEE